MKIYISGPMQGSLHNGIHDQEYRDRISTALKQTFSYSEIYDPRAEYLYSEDYPQRQAHAAFRAELDAARTCNLMVCYLPVASMGSALELFAAKMNHAHIDIITPLKENWVVNYCASDIFENIEEWIHGLRWKHRAK